MENILKIVTFNAQNVLDELVIINIHLIIFEGMLEDQKAFNLRRMTNN